MKAKEIKVGGRYAAKVSGKLTTVRVDAIREIARVCGTNYDGSRKCRDAMIYDVTNLATGRRTTFRSAQKFRGEASEKPKTATDLLNEQNTRAIAKMRKGAEETARLQEEVRRGEKTAAQALLEKCGKKPRTVADVNRDQGREMEEALGPIDESDNPSNGWRSPVE